MLSVIWNTLEQCTGFRWHVKTKKQPNASEQSRRVRDLSLSVLCRYTCCYTRRARVVQQTKRDARSRFPGHVDVNVFSMYDCTERTRVYAMYTFDYNGRPDNVITVHVMLEVFCSINDCLVFRYRVKVDNITAACCFFRDQCTRGPFSETANTRSIRYQVIHHVSTRHCDLCGITTRTDFVRTYNSVRIQRVPRKRF